MVSTSRFAEALSGEANAPLENQPLVRGVHNVVIPTVGMIIPNWLLIVPSARTLNYAEQGLATHQEARRIIEDLSTKFADPGRETLILEHGPASVESAVGCGVDHAHLHVLFLERAFSDALWQRIEADLEAEPVCAPLEALHNGVDGANAYYLAWRGGQRLLEQPVKAEISQRFRKLIAETAGVADQWDYRSHRFDDNIRRTVVASQRQHVLAA